MKKHLKNHKKYELAAKLHAVLYAAIMIAIMTGAIILLSLGDYHDMPGTRGRAAHDSPEPFEEAAQERSAIFGTTDIPLTENAAKTPYAPRVVPGIRKPEVAPAPEPVSLPVFTSLGTHQVYGYNFTDAAQCGKKVADGITASGTPAVHNGTCAMSSDIPFGTEIYIAGLGYYTVNDRGVGRGVVDIAFGNNADCYAVTGKYEVFLVERNG